MGSAGGVKITQKRNGNILPHINRVSPPLFRKLCGGRESSQPTGANRDSHRPCYSYWPVRATVSPSGLTWARARHRAFGEGVGRRG